MNTFEIILVIVGVWQIIFSIIGSTNNLTSSVVYKVIPFFIGCYCIFYALYLSNIITLKL